MKNLQHPSGFHQICIAIVVTIIVLQYGPSLFAQNNIDLNAWNQEGPLGAGNWNVAADGESVLQTVNGAPTYFVSPNNFINTTIGGSFGVETTSDDDFIGFVFGYNAPFSSDGDPVLLTDYILFDWKQGTQSGAPAGFWLGKVSGTQNGAAGIPNQLWAHVGDANLEVTQLGTPLVNAGWQDNVVYEFELIYSQTQIQLYMQGGTGPFGDRQLIYDINIADVPSGTFAGDVFPNGRFGFYNHSQSNVRYVGFTALTEVLPDSVTSTRGNYISGGPPELADNDGLDYTMRRSTSDIIARTEFEVKGISPVETPSSMTVVLDGSVFARSEVIQSIQFFDYVAGTWEPIDSRPATQQVDSRVQIDILSDFARFVEPGTLCMEARVRFQSTNPRQQFSSNTDQFAWFIGD